MTLQQTFRPVLRRLGAVLLCAGLAGQAGAVEARLDGSLPDDLRSAIESGSLVLVAAGTDAPTAQDVIAAARADYANILGLLYGEGYYGGTIHILVDGREAANLSPLNLPGSVGTVVVQVEPGPQFRFGKAAIGPLAPDTELPDGFRRGEPAKADLIRDTVDAAVGGWREVGNAKAGVAGRKIVARHPQAELDAEIAIDPGPRLTFGRLIVEGNEAVRTKRIQQIAGLRTGKVFRPEDLDTVRRRLTKTGAFKSVALEEAEQPNADGSLDIVASVVEQLPRRIGFGAEVSSIEGATLSAYWMHRNIFGGAERLRFDGEISGLGGGTGSFNGGPGIDYSLAASLARPGTFAAANTLTGRFLVAQEDEPDYFERQALVELALTRELNARTEVTAALRYSYSDVEDGLGERVFKTFSFPLTGQLDARDAPLNPKSGYFIRLELMPWVGLGGTESGGRAYADGRVYRSFGAEDRVTLAGRLQLGSVLGSSIAGTQPDLLFFSGGGGTVRGQPYKSLKIDMGGGVFAGGRSFLGASAEARVKVGKKISVVGFYDYGVIGAGSTPGDGDSHAGAGLGLRYDTALGPIRLDVATPVSGDTGNGVQVYVGIGQAF